LISTLVKGDWLIGELHTPEGNWLIGELHAPEGNWLIGELYTPEDNWLIGELHTPATILWVYEPLIPIEKAKWFTESV
jgi:hypothetical protein